MTLDEAIAKLRAMRNRTTVRARDFWLRNKERARMWCAWHVPNWLVYWCVQRACALAWKKARNKHPDEITLLEMLEPFSE